MIRAALAVCVVVLTGCAGIATYNVRPFYDQASKQVICCEATITNGKDISTVSVHVTKVGADYTMDFNETGVGATAPITAVTSIASGVAGAVTDAAITAAKFAK